MGMLMHSEERIKSKAKPLVVTILYLAFIVFLIQGVIWSSGKRRFRSMGQVLEGFYYGFLRLKKEDLQVERISETELVTISRNPCPILRLSKILKVDTRYSCKLISEPVCRYVIKRMDPRLEFERDYSQIRPYADGCKERIFLIQRQVAGTLKLSVHGIDLYVS